MNLFRATIRLAAVMAAAGAALVATPPPASACSCNFTPLSEYADSVAVAFTGHQIKRVEPDGIVSSAADVTLILEADWVYKGRTGPLVSVITNFSGVSCGIDFSGEGQVAVAAFRRDDGRLGVYLCGSQHEINDFQEVFGLGYPPEETMTQTFEHLEKPEQDSVATQPLLEEDAHERIQEEQSARDPVATQPPPQPPATPNTQLEKPARDSVATTVLSAELPPSAADDAPAPGRRAPAVALLIGTAAAILVGGAAVLLRIKRPSKDRRRRGH